MFGIIGAHDVAGVVVEILTARGHRAAGLGAHYRLGGEPGVIGVHLIGSVIEAQYVHDLRHALAETAVERRRDGPGRIQPVDQPLLDARNPGTARVTLDGLFLVADRPGDD